MAEVKSKESFVFYKSFYEAIKILPKENQLELYTILCEYSFNNEIPEDISDISRAMFTLMRTNVDSARRRYEASVENGKLGGRPRKNKNLDKPSNNLEEPNSNLNENDNVNENDNKNNNDNKNENKNKKPDKARVEALKNRLKEGS